MAENAPKILYEDKDILVAVKPAGYLSEPSSERNLPAFLTQYLERKGEKGDIFTVHRLDRAVGGVMVFARTPQAASHLTRQIAEKTVVKEYLAVLRGVPEKEADTLVDLLFRDAKINKTYVVGRMRKGVRDASLEYRLLGKTQGETPLSLVRVRLHTGRTHQIRVQFASRKLPLLGDVRYGSKSENKNPALFSCHLGFIHPKTGKEMDFFHLPPAEYPWTEFSFVLPEK